MGNDTAGSGGYLDRATRSGSRRLGVGRAPAEPLEHVRTVRPTEGAPPPAPRAALIQAGRHAHFQGLLPRSPFATLSEKTRGPPAGEPESRRHHEVGPGTWPRRYARAWKLHSSLPERSIRGRVAAPTDYKGGGRSIVQTGARDTAQKGAGRSGVQPIRPDMPRPSQVKPARYRVASERTNLASRGGGPVITALGRSRQAQAASPSRARGEEPADHSPLSPAGPPTKAFLPTNTKSGRAEPPRGRGATDSTRREG